MQVFINLCTTIIKTLYVSIILQLNKTLTLLKMDSGKLFVNYFNAAILRQLIMTAAILTGLTTTFTCI